MKEEETATAMCGRARQASDSGDDEKARMLFVLALAKAEEAHGAESMIVGLVLHSVMNFHQEANRNEEALAARLRLECIFKSRGVAGAEFEAMWLRQKGSTQARES